MLTGRCNALPKKVPKRIIHKKTITYRRGRRFFYTFLYLLGPTTMSGTSENFCKFKFSFFSFHHHHDVRLARISLTLSLHVSLSFIAFGRSSGLHPVSSHSCCVYVRAGRPAFDWPYAGVHRSTSLTISSLLLQQCPACLVRPVCIVFVIGGRWPYSWRRVGCCCQDLLNIARNIPV